MSNDALNRQIARESLTWRPFAFSFPFNSKQTETRIIIYGLYSNSYLNQQTYLVEIEAVELSNLLIDYNIKIAELTAQQQIVVADIVSKRYLASIDVFIHDQKMVTKQNEINAENLIWDAKMAALASDQAALTTLDAKVQIEILKTNVRIAELEAYLGVETYNLSEVDIQIAEKEIQAAKIDIDKLNTADEVLKIQIGIVNKAIQLVEVDLQIARTRIDIANMDRDIAKIGLRAVDLTVEQMKTSIEQAEEPVAVAKTALAQTKIAEVQAEVDFVTGPLTAQAQANLNSKMNLLDIKQEVKENSLSQWLQEKELSLDNKINTSNQEVTFSGLDKAQQELLDAQTISVLDRTVSDKSSEVYAAIAAATRMSTANIATALTHRIKAAV